jgi:hypothetical protein
MIKATRCQVERSRGLMIGFLSQILLDFARSDIASSLNMNLELLFK